MISSSLSSIIRIFAITKNRASFRPDFENGPTLTSGWTYDTLCDSWQQGAPRMPIAFMAKLSECIFEWDPHDIALLHQAKREQLEEKEVYLCWTLCGWSTSDVFKRDVKCLQDVPGVTLYIETSTTTTKGHIVLTKYRRLRLSPGRPQDRAFPACHPKRAPGPISRPPLGPNLRSRRCHRLPPVEGKHQRQLSPPPRLRLQPKLVHNTRSAFPEELHNSKMSIPPFPSIGCSSQLIVGNRKFSLCIKWVV
ncbi:hypothetical protein ROHU_007731 [Labeo rohita]|uniref:Uncharacterized protein n=1 Tax=Labeo rohita TaxID=84645 RepID=A0A498MBX6_LABRO|nr:hypothetical protein ROHU_007731 [Labeo rohita]